MLGKILIKKGLHWECRLGKGGGDMDRWQVISMRDANTRWPDLSAGTEM